MEYIVENVSGITEGLLYEALKKGSKELIYKSNIRLGRIMGISLVVVLFLFFLLELVGFRGAMKYGFIVAIAIFCMIIVTFIYINFIHIHIIVHKQFKGIQILANEDKVYCTTRFYQEYLEQIYNNGNKQVIQYNKIKEFFFTNNVYILMLNEDIVCFMQKESFTKGSLEDAQKLIWG